MYCANPAIVMTSNSLNLAAVAGSADPMATITLRVPTQLMEQLKAYADRIHANRSQLTRHVLRLGLEQIEKTTSNISDDRA